MAKDRFYRTKPHVNVSTTRWLTQRGISPLGVYQIMHGLSVTSPSDRALVAETMAESSEVKYYTITLTQARVVDA